MSIQEFVIPKNDLRIAQRIAEERKVSLQSATDIEFLKNEVCNVTAANVRFVMEASRLRAKVTSLNYWLCGVIVIAAGYAIAYNGGF